MERTFNSRPRSLASACAPTYVATAAQGHLGLPAVGILPILVAPISGLGASKINNYMGATSANGNGVATSTMHDQKVSAERVQTVQIDKVKGGSARGIPPRGRPV